MRERLNPLSHRSDVVLFTLAILTIAPLLAWWSVLNRRQLERIDTLERSIAVASVPPGEEQALRLDDITAHTERQRLMMYGETAFGGVVLAMFVAGLFVLARNRRHDNQSMRRMLQITAHELKTPLAGLKALLQSLQLGSIPAAMRLSLLERGVDECNRLEHLTETLLAYQRAVAHKRLRLQPHESSTLVRSLLEHRANSFPAEGISWQESESVSVLADADAFRVVLENLLDNARKYGAGRVELRAHAETQRYLLEVRDHGIGFLEREAEALFTPWTRAEAHSVSKHGSGLGLYLARQLAEAMGGSLTAHSPGPDQGSTFVLSLQRAPEASSHA
jgi:signal transduction histidine kinase